MEKNSMYNYFVACALLSFVMGFIANKACVAGQPPPEEVESAPICRCDPCPDPCMTEQLERRLGEIDLSCAEGAEQLRLFRLEVNERALDAPSCPPCSCDCGPNSENLAEGVAEKLAELNRNRWYHTFGLGGGYGEALAPANAGLAHVGFLVSPAHWLTVGASYARVWDQTVDVFCYDCKQGVKERLDDWDAWLVNAYIHPFRKSK